jgi:hypothetical protein
MKKFVASAMSTVLMVSALTACGTQSSAPTGSEPTTGTEVATDVATDGTSDETGDEVTFESLQDAYAELVSDYETVEAAYEDGSVEQSDELENALNEAKDFIDGLGEVTEDSFESQDDIDQTYETIITLSDALKETSGIFEDADADAEANTADEADAETAEGISDDTWAGLQEAYTTVTDGYNQAVEYVDSNGVELTDDQTAVMNEIAEQLSSQPELNREDFASEDEAEAFGELLTQYVEVLNEILGVQ